MIAELMVTATLLSAQPSLPEVTVSENTVIELDGSDTSLSDPDVISIQNGILFIVFSTSMVFGGMGAKIFIDQLKDK